ncbi:hypothetical protein CBX96_12425 [Shewanella sp. BC20]|uniref:hypothetical protein n=1 Tax=Shewanella sp. BC20 TaxID=2004459 RepID=UPI000D6439DF|nr:hypothetical protein [Shewanella sp. BC20]PWF62994.1 hypothetical protein CBX96_12425 [Shewanella sp. BC20]
MRYLTLAPVALLLGLTTSVSAEESTQWHYTMGIHDFIVEQESSHTFGFNGNIMIEHTTASDIYLSAVLDMFIDIDTDKLDPDHIPMWFKSEYAALGELYLFSPELSLGWQVDLQGKRNTVSSVEKQAKFFPGLTANYHGQQTQAQLKAGAGYYYLEIDDDVPRTRGYDRGDFGNGEFAYTLMGSFGFDITPKLNMSFAAQNWNDGDKWLENQYRFSMSYDTDYWEKGSQWLLYVEHTEYNLDHYAKESVHSPDYLPILPWDNDTLVRFSLVVPW